MCWTLNANSNIIESLTLRAKPPTVFIWIIRWKRHFCLPQVWFIFVFSMSVKKAPKWASGFVCCSSYIAEIVKSKASQVFAICSRMASPSFISFSVCSMFSQSRDKNLFNFVSSTFNVFHQDTREVKENISLLIHLSLTLSLSLLKRKSTFSLLLFKESG